MELVQIGALLHDWMKAVTFDKLEACERFNYTPAIEEIKAWKQLKQMFPDKHETEVAHELLKDTYPELAQFLLQEGSLYENASVQSWEEKIVHYADWRILGTKVIPLQQRLEDFSQRYKNKLSKDFKKWERMKHTIQQIEQEICKTLQVNPEQLGF